MGVGRAVEGRRHWTLMPVMVWRDGESAPQNAHSQKIYEIMPARATVNHGAVGHSEGAYGRRPMVQRGCYAPATPASFTFCIIDLESWGQSK